MTCHMVVRPANISSHIHQQHSGTVIRIDKAKLTAIVANEGISMDWPAVPSNPTEAFEGLTIHSGVHCPHCTAMYLDTKQMLAHVKKVHGVELRAEEPVKKGPMQHLSGCPGVNSWFSVHPKPARSFSPPSAYLVKLRDTLDERAQIPASEVDHRHISPWHTTTRWPHYLEGKDPVELIQLVAFPEQDDPLFPLVPFIQAYIKAIYDSIPYSSEVCHQILNTDTQTE